ncbi:hypothetical protein Tco_0571257 [Tanacetum coccineum]
MLQAQERERYSEADKARLLVELINERKRKFTQQRAETKTKQPVTQGSTKDLQLDILYQEYGSHTLQQLKKLSFDEVKELFETTMKRVNTFTLMESDDTVPKVIFEDMLKNFERGDPSQTMSLDDDDTLWKLQRYMHDPLKWRLYDTCVVHHVSTERGHDIFMLVEKDYPLTRALMTACLFPR